MQCLVIERNKLRGAFSVNFRRRNLIFLSPFLSGNPRLSVFLERDAREIPNCNELPSSCAALPADRGAAQPPHDEGGRPEPVRGPICAGPYRWLTFSPSSLHTTPLAPSSSWFFYCFFLPFRFREKATVYMGSPKFPLLRLRTRPAPPHAPPGNILRKLSARFKRPCIYIYDLDI